MTSLEFQIIVDNIIEVMKLQRTIISLQLNIDIIKALSGEKALTALK